MITMGGLFSGSGGFELAALWAGIIPVWSNEIDPHRAKKLQRNFIHKIIQQDVKTLNPEQLATVDIICGGDPCQPHSQAGMGKGTEDDRYLWPEMFRIIQAKRPAFVLNENVDRTITNGVLDIKIDDLESEGYTCRTYCIPAEAVGALHRRYRLWLVAYDPNKIRTNRESRIIFSPEEEKRIQERHCLQLPSEPVNLWPPDADPNKERQQTKHMPTIPGVQQEGVSRYFGFGPDARGNIPRDIIKSGVIRMLNGLPQGMDYPDRYKRIGEMGDALVPQIPFEFFKWMKQELQSKIQQP